MRREKGKRQINCLSRKKSGRTGNNREGKFNSLRLRARDGRSPGQHAIKSTDGVCVGERERENYTKNPGAIECRGSRGSFLIASDAFSQKKETRKKKKIPLCYLFILFLVRGGRSRDVLKPKSPPPPLPPGEGKKTLPEFLTPSVFSFLFPPNMRRPTAAAAVAK